MIRDLAFCYKSPKTGEQGRKKKEDVVLRGLKREKGVWGWWGVVLVTHTGPGTKPVSFLQVRLALTHGWLGD